MRIQHLYKSISKPSGVVDFAKRVVDYQNKSELNARLIDISDYKFNLSNEVLVIHVVYNIKTLCILSIYTLIRTKNIFIVSHGSFMQYNFHFRKRVFLSILKFLTWTSKSKVIYLNKEEYINSYKLSNFPIYKRPIVTGRYPEVVKNINTKSLKVCYVGAYYDWRKGFDRIETVCRNLVRLGYKVELHLVGLSSTECARNFCDDIDVYYYGFVKDRSMLKSIISSCDIGILTSRSEGLPLSVLDFLAEGLPVILSTETNMLKELKEYELAMDWRDTDKVLSNFTGSPKRYVHDKYDSSQWAGRFL